MPIFPITNPMSHQKTFFNSRNDDIDANSDCHTRAIYDFDCIGLNIFGYSDRHYAGSSIRNR